MLGAGWEAWAGEQWSVGSLGRLQYAGLSLEESGGSDTVDADALILALLATLTYH
jgi:hypothetical protein